MIPSTVRIFVCTEPQDMRRSFDGLALATKEVLAKDPQSGSLFCFVNKRANRLKVLWWDTNGYCLLYKRLHRAAFVLPGSPGERSVRIDGTKLAKIIAGVARERRRRRRVNT
jgi:transposase